ncbi:MAG: cytochrome c peroxidase [Chitinophagales bacterium]
MFQSKVIPSFLLSPVCIFCIPFYFLILSACSVDPDLKEDAVYTLPEGFPPLPIPDDNPITAEKIALGKKLFFDTALSIDSAISCGSCHKQQFAFSDDVAVSPGVEGRIGFRNAPSLANVAYYPELLKDGGTPTLETQVFVPLETHEEMGFNMVLLVERLRKDAAYVQEYNAVFGGEIQPFGIVRAIAAYERTLLSGYSAYDAYLQGDNHALNASEKNGMQLFFSDRLGCGNCHNGFLLTDNSYQCDGYFSDYTADPGRERITFDPADIGKFRVPTLRNIALTAPYMHDGSVASLEDIIDTYAVGGSGFENQSTLIQPFTLTNEERTDLISFLVSLNDYTFISDPEFAP